MSIYKTLNSVLNQTFTNFEILIVNDGSTDNSLSIVQEFSDPRIVILNQSNSGVSHARNLGISASKHEYIAFLDADDLWEPNYLSEMADFIAQFPLASLFGCSYFIVDHKGKIKNSCPSCLSINFKGYLYNYFEQAIEHKLYWTSAVIAKRDAFNSIGFFDTQLAKGEDLDLWIRFALNVTMAYYNKPLAYYRLDSENRAMRTNGNKVRSLIWNLDRYCEYENSNDHFKIFIDSLRLDHISNYLGGDTCEVEEIDTFFNAVDLRQCSLYWRIMSILPDFGRIILYQLSHPRIVLSRVKQRVFSRRVLKLT